MEPSARLFNCLRCQAQVIICSKCDRGQMYCSSLCSQAVRKASCRSAGIRYQNTYQGRLKHAARQQGYRRRQQGKKEIVTHQGLPENSKHDLLKRREDKARTSVNAVLLDGCYCHFCKKKVSDFLRRRYLDQTNHLFLKAVVVLGQGP